MEKQIRKLIEILKKCAKEVLQELGGGWKEEIYQKAMEVALRNRGIAYETQRILPITFSGHVIGDAIPDLVIWTKVNGRRVALVVDLKAEPGVKEEHQVQVQRYIKELRKQVAKSKEEVFPKGLVINFVRERTARKLQEGFEDLGGLQILEVTA